MKFRDFIFGMIIAMIICSCGRQQNDLTRQEASGDVKSIRTTTDDQSVNNLIEFNKDGYFTEISYFNHNGDLSQKIVYVYDGDGKVTKINRYDGDGDEMGRTVFTYNNNKKVTKIVYYDESGKIHYTRKYEWEGDKVTKTQYIDEFSEINFRYEYNGNTIVQKPAAYVNGKPTGEYTEYENEMIKKIVNKDFTTSLTFNSKGLCTSIVNGQLLDTYTYSTEPVKGESYTYDYEYDDKDNWIKKIERKKGSQKATRIFVREIEYF